MDTSVIVLCLIKASVWNWAVFDDTGKQLANGAVTWLWQWFAATEGLVSSAMILVKGDPWTVSTQTSAVVQWSLLQYIH